MDKRSYELIGSPCGQHGQYTFYKAIRLTAERESIVAIGDFFFVRIWQDSELVSIGELQLLWTDRVSDQTLVSLRLYFLPENTPDGRNLHGQDEVLAINDKVVVRAEDLLSWMCDGSDWRWGLRAVWRGACTPPTDPRTTQPLHHTKLDFGDVEKEKNAIVDPDSPGVVVFSYPRYCRYRALLSRLEGIQADWLRDSLVAALGGYAAPTKNTRILYCKDTFEYPELEGNEFVCNHLAPKLKGRPRGRRRRRARSRSHTPSSRSSDSEAKEDVKELPRVTTSRRLSLRNGAPERERKSEEDEDDEMKKSDTTAEDKAFLQQLKNFYKERNENVKIVNSLNVSLRRLYTSVVSRGGYEAVCRHKLWRSLHTIHPSSPPLALPTPDQPARARRVYERYLLPFESYERRNGLKLKISNGRTEPTTIDTIDVTDSPLREDTTNTLEIKHNTLRTPSPKLEKELSIDQETGEPQKDDLNIIVKPAEELNREFLESLPKEEEKIKITIKPVEKLVDNNVMSLISFLQNVDVVKLFEDNCVLINELVVKHNLTDSSKVIDEVGRQQVSDGSAMFLKELAQKLNLGNIEYGKGQQIGLNEGQRQISVGEGQLGQVSSSEGQGQLGALQSLSTLGDKYAVNGHTSVSVSIHTNTEQKVRPAGRSSLRAVRVKPTRQPHAQTPPIPPVRSDSSGSPPSVPPLNNFGIHRPPSQSTTQNNNSDDEIVEVPYKPKTPEIIDLDEYPESPQGVKKKKLDILKERGLEVTAIPTTPAWGTVPPVINPIAPLIPNQMILNPAVQHQIMTQAQLFQMYNIIPQNYANGIQPPKVIQATSAFGSSGPEKTVYGNPKDPFMPPPHVLLGTPIKPLRTVQSTPTPPQDILDLTCKNATVSPQKPAVEIVRIPNVPSPKTPTAQTPQNLSKNYTLIDGKAVVGSNLEITLVNPKNQTPPKNRQPQKRSSNGKFVSTKTPTPPKDYPKSYPAPTPPKKAPIIVPNYQINRDDVSPTSSTGSRDSQSSNFMKSQNSLAQMMDLQKSAVPSLNPFIDPIYMSALYSSLAGQVDQRQLAVYRDLMANQVRGYSGLLNMGVTTPTTKN